MDLPVRITLDHACVFEVDQVLFLQGPQFVEYLVGGVDPIKSKYDQIAHRLVLPGLYPN
jgi:hypothetical protein